MSVKLKIVITIIILVFISSSVLTFILVKNQIKSAKEEIEKGIQNYSNILSSLGVEVISSLRTPQITLLVQKLLEDISLQPYLLYAVILSKDKKVIDIRIKEGEELRYKDTFWETPKVLYYYDTGVEFEKLPIAKKPKKEVINFSFKKNISSKVYGLLGFVELGFDKRIIFDRIIAILKYSLIASSFLFLGCIIFGLLLSLHIIYPIHKLTVAAEKFGSENLEYRVKLKRKDEFGKLSATFNKMAESLKNAYDELKSKYKEIMVLFKQATEDGLTQTFVKRYLIELFDKELDRAKRYKKPISFVMCDIDYFKKFNDTYGHLVGDIVLKKVAELLLNNVRENDIVGRYGGEEFGIILPGMDKEAAISVAEKLRNAVENNEIKYDNKTLKVTLSLGVTSILNPKIHRDTVIEWADKALYESKQQGRNKVSFYAEI